MPLKIPARRAEYSLTENVASPFQAEPRQSLWQVRLYDFNVRSRGKVKEKLNYMHVNPVIRKLVRHPKDWIWSSWLPYMKGEKGLMEIDVFV